MPLIAKPQPLQFERTLPCLPKHGIISSKAVAMNDKGFTPSYLKSRENMNFIMSDQYYRDWFRELHQFDTKNDLAIAQSGFGEGVKRRRIVIINHAAISGKIKKVPIIKPKEFRHLYYPPEKKSQDPKLEKYKLFCPSSKPKHKPFERKPLFQSTKKESKPKPKKEIEEDTEHIAEVEALIEIHEEDDKKICKNQSKVCKCRLQYPKRPQVKPKKKPCKCAWIPF